MAQKFADSLSMVLLDLVMAIPWPPSHPLMTAFNTGGKKKKKKLPRSYQQISPYVAWPDFSHILIPKEGKELL